MMKKLLQFSIIAAFLAFTALALPATNTSTVHAAATSASVQSPKVAAVSCSGDNCNGKSPVSTGCSATSLVTHQVTFSSHGGGYVEFVFSATCHAAWGFIHFNTAMPSGHTGDAGIANSTGAGYICSQGGNNEVMPGQHSCYTGMVGDESFQTARVIGFFDDTVIARTANYW